MIRPFHFFALILATGIFLSAGLSCAEPSEVSSKMTGHWKGRAQIVVAWCRQKTLLIDVVIHPDGRVSGKVGDATLVDGRFEQNRGKLGKKLNLATDFIIKGKLDRPVVRAESITRDSVSIPLNFSGGVFSGGLHTSGSKFGGKKKGILSAASLTLKLQRDGEKPEASPKP